MPHALCYGRESPWLPGPHLPVSKETRADCIKQLMHVMKTNVPEGKMSRLQRREQLGRASVVREVTVGKLGLDPDHKKKKKKKEDGVG